MGMAFALAMACPVKTIRRLCFGYRRGDGRGFCNGDCRGDAGVIAVGLTTRRHRGCRSWPRDLPVAVLENLRRSTACNGLSRRGGFSLRRSTRGWSECQGWFSRRPWRLPWGLPNTAVEGACSFRKNHDIPRLVAACRACCGLSRRIATYHAATA